MLNGLINKNRSLVDNFSYLGKFSVQMKVAKLLNKKVNYTIIYESLLKTNALKNFKSD